MNQIDQDLRAVLELSERASPGDFTIRYGTNVIAGDGLSATGLSRSPDDATDRNEANAALIAALPEPGVVSDEAVAVAADVLMKKWNLHPYGANRMATVALEAAMPYLTPAAPAGEVAALPAAPWLGYDPDRGDLHGFSHDEVRAILASQPAPAAQGFDAEVAKALGFLLTRIGSWTSARWDQHLRHEFGDKRAGPMIAALAAAAKGGTNSPLWLCGFCRRSYTPDALCCDEQREYRAAAAKGADRG